jgi:hypothetical protein
VGRARHAGAAAGADRRTLLHAAAANAGVLALAWGPFVLFGQFAMYRFDCQIRPGSLLPELLPVESDFGWELRLLQGALALGAGTTVAALRGSVHAVWGVLLAIAGTRLLVDPVSLDHYWLPAKVLALLALGAFGAGRDARVVVLVPLLYQVFLVGLVPHAWAAACCLLAVAVLVGMERRPEWLLGLKFHRQAPNVTLDTIRSS